MKTTLNAILLSRAISAAIVLALLIGARASAGTIDLGAANGYAVVGFGTVSVTDTVTQDGGANVNGNVAIGTYGTLNMSNGAKINGLVDYDSGTSSVTLIGGSSISGGKTDLGTTAMQAIDNAATTASTNYAALTTTLTTLTSITGNTTITGTGGQNVIDVGYVDLSNGHKLTINGNGSGNDTFIINLTGGSGGQAFDIGGGASIVLGTGVSANQVLFNITGSNEGVTIGNGATTSGIFLDVDGGISVTSGTISDDLISGTSLDLTGGSTINGLPAPVPVPAAVWMGLVTVGGLVGFMALRRRA